MKTFAILNQKGGTGKTTIAINLAAQLAEANHRVLMVDMDPQGNASSGSGIDKKQQPQTVYDIINGEAAAADIAVFCEAYGYHILPANSALAGAEIELTRSDDWRTRLHDALAAVAGDYDYAFIDCPPSLGVLSVNALIAAQKIIIPMQCEYFALEGLTDIADTIRRLRDGWNPQLAIAGIVRSMLDERNLLARDVSRELRTHFGDKVFDSAIVRNIRIAEAPSHHLPISRYAPNSTGANSFRLLGQEFMQRFA